MLDSLDEITLAIWGDHCPFGERVVNASLTQGAQMFHGDVGHLVAFDMRHFHKGTSGGSGISIFEVAHGGSMFVLVKNECDRCAETGFV